MGKPISRREALKSLASGVAAGAIAHVVPLGAAERAHKLIEAQRSSGIKYAPKFFSVHQYKTLQALCDAIIPPDEQSGGAVEAGAPEFIDLLTSENPDFQLKLGGGIMWLDAASTDRFGQTYLACTADQQKHMLDSIAYRKNSARDPGLSQGVDFFSFLRHFTADGFFTSKIGIAYLGYVGNTFLSEFPGCPPVSEA